MSKQTESNLFILPSLSQIAGFYQHLLFGITTYEELGVRLLKQIRTAYAFRQVERVRELSNILARVGIREYRVIAQFYLVWCEFRESKCNYEGLESVIAQTRTYKSKALIWRAGFEIYEGNSETALYFYNEALKANPTTSDYIVASRGIALVKSMEGFHTSALKDLERLIPLLTHAEPLTYYDVLNSYAVELVEHNRLSEARGASLVAASSPLGGFYPEWQATASEIRSKSNRRSIVSIGLPKPESHEVEASRSASNVLQFPTGEPMPDIQAILESNEVREELLLTPVQLLALILKVMLKDRITDEEVEEICLLYYDTLVKWYTVD